MIWNLKTFVQRIKFPKKDDSTTSFATDENAFVDNAAAAAGDKKVIFDRVENFYLKMFKIL